MVRFFLLIATLLAALPVRAADIRLEVSEGIDFIYISGEIIESDVAHFQRIAIGSESAAVVLDSPGGSLVSALKIGEIIKLKGFGTVVPDKVTCVSSCALIWVAGSTRFLGPNSKIGFHASYTDENGVQSESGLGNALVGRYLTLLNLPEKAIIFATSAGPSEVRWLDASSPYNSGIEFVVLEDSSDNRTASDGAVRSNSPVEARAFNWSDDRWTVYQGNDGASCSMEANYTSEGGSANQSVLLIAKSTQYQGLLLAFVNERFRSIIPERTYKIKLIFESDGQVDAGWGEMEFEGVELDSGLKGLAIILNQDDLAPDLREEKNVGFFLGDELIDQYPLEGSARALRQLYRCFGEISSRDDPFAR